MMSFLILKDNDFEYVIHQLIDNYLFLMGNSLPVGSLYKYYVRVELLERQNEW
jgi:hypothetical protein